MLLLLELVNRHRRYIFERLEKYGKFQHQAFRVSVQPCASVFYNARNKAT